MGSFVRVALTSEQLPKPGHKRCVQSPSKPTTTPGVQAPISLQWSQKKMRLAFAGQGRSLESSAPLTGGLIKKKQWLFGVVIPERCWKKRPSPADSQLWWTLLHFQPEFWNTS